MALPLILFSLLCLAGLILLIVGFLKLANENGVALLPLSGIVFIVTGALLWTSGLELNQVASIDTSSEIMTYTYQVITVSDGSPLWVLANIVFFGGFLIILIGLGKIMQLKREKKFNETEKY
jgi:TRAP-type C4-dicarboxylate transport system permease small subunit